MTPLNGLILAGGRSQRMGEDKAGLSYYGQMHTHYLAKLLAPFVDDVLVSVRKEQMHAPYLHGLKAVFDRYQSPSPLNGILSAMRINRHASLLVVAVDMPYINAAAIRTLLRGRDESAPATCYESPAKGGPDPLFAIWEAHAFPQFEAQLAGEAQHVCPRSVLKSLPTHILRGEIAPEVLENINTPEDWAAMKVS